MRYFKPAPGSLGELLAYILDFVPRADRELQRIEEKIPDSAPTVRETGEQLLNDPDFLDSVYRYIKQREERET